MGSLGLGTSAFLWGRAEYECANGDRRRVWKLHEAAPAGEGSGVGEARLKLLGDFLAGDNSIGHPKTNANSSTKYARNEQLCLIIPI